MKSVRACIGIGCGALLAALSGLAAATQPQASLSAAMDLILKENRPLPAIEMLRTGVEDGTIPATQVSAQFYAVSGDSPGTYRMNDRHNDVIADYGAPPDLPDAKLLPAIPAIVRASAGKRVVMLNEDHYHQMHRAFGLQVLNALRTAGFTHFGAETFSPSVNESMADGAPDLRTGVYTSDPLYADMARQAAAKGYVLFDYDQRPEQDSGKGSAEDQRLARERAQAGNIAAILKTHPAARIFIYAGSGHIAESSSPGGAKWMAQILKEEHGVDPLTVNQVIGTPRSRPNLDGPLYQAVSSTLPLARPSAVSTSDGLLTERGFDMVIFHPREQQIRGRADWMRIDGYRRPCRVAIPASPQATMIRAFVDSEDSRSIPMDQVRVSPRQTEAMLALPVGTYRLVRQTLTDDEVIGKGVITSRGRGAKRNDLCLPVSIDGTAGAAG